MKLGIALGGGGARGFSHIGVLKSLARAGIQFDVVTGTSIGALVGALYANNKLTQLEEQSKRIRFFDVPLLLSPTVSLSGMFSGRRAMELLAEFVDVETIEDLPVPYAAVACDLYSGEIVSFTSGSLQQAVRASIAIPGVFTPVRSGRRLLIDGGTLEPVPVQAARALGADIVVAIDLFGNRSARPDHAAKPSDGDTQRVDAPHEVFTNVATVVDYLRSLPKRLSLRDLRDSASEQVGAPNVLE
ncbi:MAG: patatin-like phospholipase family protein, partial [Bdellovibrionales bacterium]|nr:patatin-like phospholipase family protein [Bdellovibrionales bacterium]